MKWFGLTGGALLNIMFAACASTGGGTVSKHELVVCGWDEVFILDFDRRNDKGQPEKVWSWKAENCKDMPEEFRKMFGTTDDCKPFEGGKKILITSSGGAVAYVERESGRVLFYGKAVNAHSADILPNNRIAVASSFGQKNAGDRLILYEIGKPDKELLHETLPGGHGMVWDEKRQLLWALSYTDIRVYRLESWDTSAPKLALLETIPLPEGAGHDFYPVPDTSFLSVTTGRHVWLFDRDKKSFSPHPELGNLADVKCVCQDPQTKQIVYVQGEGNHWWAERLRFINPEDSFQVPGEHFYKARWISR